MHRRLDIFNDSRDAALRNDLAQTLLDGDQVAARRLAYTPQAEFGAGPRARAGHGADRTP
jgi:hypothetical protein